MNTSRHHHKGIGPSAPNQKLMMTSPFLPKGASIVVVADHARSHSHDDMERLLLKNRRGASTTTTAICSQGHHRSASIPAHLPLHGLSMPAFHDALPNSAGVHPIHDNNNRQTDRVWSNRLDVMIRQHRDALEATCSGSAGEFCNDEPNDGTTKSKRHRKNDNGPKK